MKRRLFLFALAVALPAALFLAAKRAAHWRPVAVSRINNSQPGYVWIAAISPRYLVARDGVPSDVLFDLQTGKQRPLEREGIATAGAWRWKVEPEREQLVLREADKPAVRYNARDAASDFAGKPFHWVFKDVRVSEQKDRVELLLDERYYRWSKSSRRLERQIQFDVADGNDRALSRDGETIITAGYQAITTTSTRDGHTVQRRPFAGFRIFGWSELSPFGSYAFYPTFDDSKAHGPEVLRLIETRSGRVLWTLDGQAYAGFDAFFSADEKWIAMPVNRSNQWQIREVATGRFIRNLPLVSTSILMRGAPKGAFSPDKATLYSVADGVLYRQRAR